MENTNATNTKITIEYYGSKLVIEENEDMDIDIFMGLIQTITTFVWGDRFEVTIKPNYKVSADTSFMDKQEPETNTSPVRG